VARHLSPEQPELGVLFDDIEGEDALYRVGRELPWIGRKIEWTGPAPLRFREGKTRHAPVELAGHQIVKCLVPVAGPDTQAIQDERLRELAAAANCMASSTARARARRPSRRGASAANRIRAIQSLGCAPTGEAAGLLRRRGLVRYRVRDLRAQSNVPRRPSPRRRAQPD